MRWDRVILAAVVALAISTFAAISWWLNSTFGPEPLLARIGHVAAFVTLFGATISIVNRVRTLVTTLEDRPPRWLPLTGLIVLMFSGVAVLTIEIVTVAQLAVRAYTTGGGNLADLTTRAIASGYLAILFLFGASRMHLSSALERQKRYICAMSSAGNGWKAPVQSMPHLAPQNTNVPPSVHHDFSVRLQLLLDLALRTITYPSAEMIPLRRGRTAVLYIADYRRECFMPVSYSGGTTEYFDALRAAPPPFFDRTRFVAEYNRFYHRAQKPARKRPPSVREFREAVADFTSTAGVVFELERKLCFDRVWERCLTQSVKFLDCVPEAQREQFHFNQLVAIPIYVFQRKVGTLVFTATRRHVFRRSDNAYEVVGNLVGGAIETGLAIGFFPQVHGVDLQVADVPAKSPRSASNELVNILNQVRHDFRQPVV